MLNARTIAAFGIAALEARSAGLPVIGYRRNGLVDFIADGFDGVLVADQPEMVQALVDLIGRPGYLRRLLDNTTSAPPSISPAEAVARARGIWSAINEPNLEQNIRPTRSRATLVLRKDADHSVRYVRLRKI